MLAATAGSPSLPLFVVLPAMLAYLALILVLCTGVGWSTRLLVVTFACRLAMSALPDFSYDSSPAGLSWNALVSVILVGIGMLQLHRSRAVQLILIPLVPLTLVVIASSAINREIGGGIESLVKYAYFAMIALTGYDAFKADGPSKVLTRLCLSFLLPLVLQYASLALGIAKATESDGSASYIGGYNHEASFSIILLTGLLVATLHPRLKAGYKLVISAVVMFGIVAANYRTAIITAAPLLLALLTMLGLSAVPSRQRLVAATLGVLLVLSLVPVIPQLAGDRFDALTELADNPGILAKKPNEFRRSDMAIMSGRLYLWSFYVDDWRRGDDRQHWIGYGANAWEGKYRYYAHNTLVSTLYELGILGVAAMLFLWGWMLALALSCSGIERITLVLSHLGFLLLNQATMPIWMIEGLLFYGILCGYTVHIQIGQWRLRNRTRLAPSIAYT